MSWQQAIILNTGEQVLHSWNGNCERHQKAVFKEKGLIRDRYVTKEAKERDSGVLALTNQRLIWFERRGMLSKTHRAAFEIALRELQGITCGGTINKWVSITDKNGEYIFHLYGVGKKEIEPFRDMILRQVEKLKADNSETLNVNIKKEIIRTTREEIPPIWKCAYCHGANFKTLIECKHCGAPRKIADEDCLSAIDPHQITE